MLELMEEHFNEGDYVEGSKMMKSLYDDKNDILVKKIDMLEDDVATRDDLIGKMMLKLKIQEKEIKAQDERCIEITKLVEEQGKLLDETNKQNELLINRLENRERSDVNEILQMLNIDRNEEYVEPPEKE
tara:strand:+ start:74 stop:463 length:390 start_codon:yes stop_codon:yes gene_type:complete